MEHLASALLPLFLVLNTSTTVIAKDKISPVGPKTPSNMTIICEDPHGPDPHGPDPHDEIHDQSLPSNSAKLPANQDPHIYDDYMKRRDEERDRDRDKKNR